MPSIDMVSENIHKLSISILKCPTIFSGFLLMGFFAEDFFVIFLLYIYGHKCLKIFTKLKYKKLAF